MSDDFFKLPNEVQRSLLIDAESHLNVRSIVLEKDIWLCWVLRELFILPIAMAFKGGTSLSKVYGLTRRFSEDIDITLDYRNFCRKLDFTLSKSALKKLSEHLKGEVKQYVYGSVLPHMQKSLEKYFPQKEFKITLSEDGEQLRIYYPSLFEPSDYYLQNNLLIEFGGRNSIEPSYYHTVSTLLSKVVTGLELPTAQVKALSPLRTFWEKATLIHVECGRGRLLDDPNRLSRHWYDLAMLIQAGVGQEALKNQELFKDVLQHKIAFFNASYAHYGDCLSGRFRLIPDINELKQLKTDFAKMHDSGMFPEKTLSFDEIIGVLGELELQINGGVMP